MKWNDKEDTTNTFNVTVFVYNPTKQLSNQLPVGYYMQPTRKSNHIDYVDTYATFRQLFIIMPFRRMENWVLCWQLLNTWNWVNNKIKYYCRPAKKSLQKKEIYFASQSWVEEKR